MHLSPGTQPNCDSSSSQHSRRRFLFFLGIVALFRLFLVFHQPYDAETDTCPQPYNPFHFYRIGPIFTRRSRAGTFRKKSARLSKNGPMVTFAFSLPRHTSTRDTVGSEGVQMVFAHDLGL